jgi:uncharacterized membrane protein
VKSSTFFSEQDKQRVKSAVELAEKATSGEIRVHVESRCKEDVLDRAAYVFSKLGMHLTRERNGVLIYLSLDDRQFAILGDVGINQVVPEGFWDRTSEAMIERFKAGDITAGLEAGIKSAGEQLSIHFPYQENDVNELSNEMTFGDV